MKANKNMKNTYIRPTTESLYAEAQQIMALSLQDGNATGDDALAKPSNWDIWNDEENTVE